MVIRVLRVGGFLEEHVHYAVADGHAHQVQAVCVGVGTVVHTVRATP